MTLGDMIANQIVSYIGWLGRDPKRSIKQEAVMVQLTKALAEVGVDVEARLKAQGDRRYDGGRKDGS